MDTILGDLKEREKARERGTWKQALRQQYAPWFDDLVYGIEVKDGWRAILVEAMEGIARAVGGPQTCPDLRLTRLRQDFGALSCQIQGLPDGRRGAVNRVIQMASDRSLRTCEWCGSPGSVRESGRGIRHTACDQHMVTD